MKSFFATLLLFIFTLPAHSQSDDRVNQQLKKVKIQRATDEIVLDGVIKEASWQHADVANDFWQKSPRDDIKALIRTEARLTYDDNFLYIAAFCYDSSNHVIPTMKRDVGFFDGDSFGVILDPLNEASSGFLFGTNPYGVQNDALLGGGSGEQNYSSEWDNRWYAETRQYPDRWTVEMAIPFKTLRFEAGKTTWGVNFLRNDKKNNRRDMWAKVPIQFWMIDLGYAGQLIWDEAPEKNNGNFTVIPYVNTSSSRDYEAGEDGKIDFNIGLDAKIAVSSSLNLDLTVNPDFSQVEVDDQVTNLTRFSIFLPEKRTFFLENSDIFTSYGPPSIQPFFSRKIGLDEDGRAVPIAFGARLTGNATGTTRVGILNVQTNATDNQLAQNYTAASVSQRVFKRSRIQGLFINRQAFEEGEMSTNDYGRNASLKFNYLNTDGSFEFWSGVNRSFKHEVNSDQYYLENGAGYSSRSLDALFEHIYMGTNYYADVGFINFLENYDAARDTTIRLGYHLMFLPITYRLYPQKSNILNRHSINYLSTLKLDPSGLFVEFSNAASYKLEFKNSSELEIGYERNETDLRFPFTFTDAEPLPVGIYKYGQTSFEFDSDERKMFQYKLDLSTGSFYNGNLTSARLGLLYRQQPWGNFGVEIEYNRLSFPEPYGKTTIWAFNQKIEISFNRNLFWTTFLQYNTQADNFNINSRFQWRFAPMSDFYLVYTDNYAVENFVKKNRAIVLKVNYWLVL